MTDLRKAAEEVLEAWGWDWSEPRNEALKERMEALRQALAQPEQEPVAWMNNDYEVFFDAGKAACYSMGWIKPLYTAPPKREWVDLSREEMLELFEKYDGRPFSLMLATHDKAKEKNT